MADLQKILKKGSTEVRVRISGIHKKLVLNVVWEKSPLGRIPYLVSEYFIPASELVRLAEELQMPVKSKGMAVFPKGKAASDFAEKSPSDAKAGTDEESDEPPDDEEAEYPEEPPEEEEAEEPPEEEEAEEKEESDEPPGDREPGAKGEQEPPQQIELENQPAVQEKSPKGNAGPPEEPSKRKLFSGVLSEGILS